jgi:hypothetical protein
MGRAFKVGGFTDASVDLLGKEDEGLSIPANLPISIISKLRYKQATMRTAGNPKAGEERGMWDMPDELAIYVGGRLSKNAGYSLEIAGGGWGKGAIIFMIPLGGDIKVGIDINSTDAHGPANGMEILNTAVDAAQKGFESRPATQIFQNLGMGTAAVSLGAHAASDLFFVNVALWGPANYRSVGADGLDTGLDLALYYRAVITPTLAGWDTALGVWGISGSAKCVDCGLTKTETTTTDSSGKSTTTSKNQLTEIKVEGMGVDFQVQGDVAGMSLEVNGAYGKTGKADKWPWAEVSGFDVNAFLGITSSFGVKAAMMSKDDKTAGKKTNATTIGLWYLIAQNIQFFPEYTIYGGEGRDMNNRLVVTLFMGF